ncbi:hypothetical protein CEXT_259411 [Caerostris extrusa]|uniref:Uncharacterized protein n=1 Tax=Caerostris extrusa TaxID=172846 RepID=A0AAV4M5N8_CAEEX|nr:hypothetical protein CEXT_259411 [Caerostris extrusa]
MVVVDVVPINESGYHNQWLWMSCPAMKVDAQPTVVNVSLVTGCGPLINDDVQWISHTLHRIPPSLHQPNLDFLVSL